jgi:hypothetical protein
MRETAVESHPFGFAQGRLFSQSARKGWRTRPSQMFCDVIKAGDARLRKWHGCGIPLIAKNAMSGVPSPSDEDAVRS